MMDGQVKAAEIHAAALAKLRNHREVSPDDMLLAALEIVATLGMVVLGPITIDLHVIRGDSALQMPDSSGPQPTHSRATAAVLGRAEALARADGRRSPGLIHVLGAFATEEVGLMGRLKRDYGFGGTEWREALVRWHRVTPQQGPDPVSRGRLLSVDGAAEALGVHAQTIRSYIRSGKLEAYRLGGERVIRIYASDLYELLEPLEPESPAGASA